VSEQDGAWIAEVENQIAAVQPAVLATLGKIERAVVLAKAVGALRKSLTPERMAPIMQLQGTPLGFRTDKDRDGGYDMEVVREAVIEAAINGVDVVGNQFNIISRRCYITREGMSKMLRDWRGLTDLRINLGVPTGKGDGALVPFEVSWMLGGVSDELKGIVPVKVNNGMGADAILGKADRKVKARIYSRISGSEFTHEGEVDDTIGEPKKADDTADALKKLRENQTPNPAPAPKASTSDPAADASAAAQRSGQQGDARREATGTTKTEPKEERAPWET
jgi:hypothetical protein